MRFDSRVVLGNYWQPIAEQEDQWDAMMNEQLGIKGEEGRWVDVVLEADRENMWAYERSLAADRALARKMQAIVDKETALALQEGEVIIRGRKGRPIRRYTKRR